MMSEYLLINLAVIIIPLILSFEKKLRFYRNFKAFGISFLIVGGAFIIWDIIAAKRGDWAFNEKFIIGFNVLGLPIEEILFFFTVPYASIFIYETFAYYLKEKEIKSDPRLMVIPAVLFFLISLVFTDRYYTMTVMIFTSIFFFMMAVLSPRLTGSRIYFIFILFSYFPFFIVNYLLTSLPVVTYSPNAILGIRITTIPLEDFFYSFSMLSLYLFFYLFFKEKWQEKRKSE